MNNQAPTASSLLDSETVIPIHWEAEQFRCTSFLSPLFDVSAESAFRSFAKCDAVHVSENRQQALQTATGIFNGFKLDVVKLPGRVDMILRSNEESPSSPGVAVLGLYSEMMELFDGGIRGWLESKPKLQRLALGVIALDEVDDRITGYKILNQLLPKVDLDEEHSSDFFYQINRPRLVTFGGDFSIKLNRLSKWSTATIVSQTLMLSAKGPNQTPLNAVAAIRNYSRIELDLNTDPEVLELPTKYVDAIWKKLVDLARELLLKGDIP